MSCHGLPEFFARLGPTPPVKNHLPLGYYKNMYTNVYNNNAIMFIVRTFAPCKI